MPVYCNAPLKYSVYWTPMHKLYLLFHLTTYVTVSIENLLYTLQNIFGSEISVIGVEKRLKKINVKYCLNKKQTTPQKMLVKMHEIHGVFLEVVHMPQKTICVGSLKHKS